MKKVVLFLMVAFSMNLEAFGMYKSKVLENLKECLSISEALKILIQSDEILTPQEWDSFYERGVEKWEKSCKKKKGNIQLLSNLLKVIYGEYHLQRGMHYQDLFAGGYDLNQAIKEYEIAASFGNFIAEKKFIILGLDSKNPQIKAKAVEYSEQWLARANIDCLLGDATILTTLGVYYEIEKENNELALNCYQKAVEILKKENHQDIEETNAWKNLQRLTLDYPSV